MARALIFLSLLRGGMSSEYASMSDEDRCMGAAVMNGFPAGTACCTFIETAFGLPSGDKGFAAHTSASDCARVFYAAIDGDGAFTAGWALPKTYEHKACSDFFYRETMPTYYLKDDFGNPGVVGEDYGSKHPDAALQFLWTPGLNAYLGPNESLLSTEQSPDMATHLNVIAVVFLSMAAVISFVSTYLGYKRCHYHYALRSQICTILVLPGITAVFAICEVYATKLQAAHLLIFDSQCTMRCIYLLAVISFSLDMLAMRTGKTSASVEESAEIVGADLERLNLPRRKYSMMTMSNVGPYWMGPSPFLGMGKTSEWFATSYVPNRAFLHSCVWRIKAAGYGFGFCTVMRPFTMDLGKHADPLNPTAPDTAYLWLLCIALSLMGLGLSGLLPLYEVVDPISNPTPDAQLTDKLRKLHFVFFFFIVGLGHGTIALISSNLYPDDFLPFWTGLKTRVCANTETMAFEMCPKDFDGIPCLWFIYHEPIFLCFELFIVALLGYRAWLPPFKWQGCPCAPFEVDSSDPTSVFLNCADMNTGSYEKVEALLASQMSTNFVSMSDEMVKEIFNGSISIADAKAKQTAIVAAAVASMGSSATAMSTTGDVEVMVLSAEKAVSVLSAEKVV